MTGGANSAKPMVLERPAPGEDDRGSASGMTRTGAESQELADGRRRRSAESRARIVAAMMELVHAGDVSPGVERVAARAQVGLRTVFRHFKDMDTLYAEMTRVLESELLQVLQAEFRSQDWRDRLIELVERRAFVFDKLAPYKRAGDVHRHSSRLLQADHQQMVRAQRERLREILPPELRRDAVRFELLDLAMSFEAWLRLRYEQQLTPRRAREVVETAVRAITASAPTPA